MFCYFVPVCPSDVAELWNVRRPRLEALGVTLSLDLLTSLSNRDVPHVVCHVSSRLCPGYGTYKLTISPKQVGWKYRPVLRLCFFCRIAQVLECGYICTDFGIILFTVVSSEGYVVYMTAHF